MLSVLFENKKSSKLCKNYANKINNSKLCKNYATIKNKSIICDEINLHNFLINTMHNYALICIIYAKYYAKKMHNFFLKYIKNF